MNSVSKASANFIIPRDNSASEIIDHLENLKTGWPLLTIHGPSGAGMRDLASTILPNRLRVISGKSSPALNTIQIDSDTEPVELAGQISNLIIEHHPELKSRKAATAFREKIDTLVHTNPSEAATRMRAMMRGSEKSQTSIKKLQLVIHLDGLDRLFEKPAAQSKKLKDLNICGQEDSPLAFLAQLIGMNSLMFVITYREWICPYFDHIADSAQLTDGKRLDINMAYPDKEEADRIVSRMLLPIHKANDAVKGFEHDENAEEITLLGERLTKDLKRNPSIIGSLPTIIETLFKDENSTNYLLSGSNDRLKANKGTSGLIAAHTDAAFIKQDSASQAAQEELILRLIEKNGKISFRDVIKETEHWQAALQLVSIGALTLQKRGRRKAILAQSHHKFTDSWERAQNWANSDQLITKKQLHTYEDKALAWKLGDRKKSLLLSSEQCLEQAAVLMADTELKSQLTPITQDYLAKSINPQPISISILKKAAIPGGIAFMLLASGLYIWFLPELEDSKPLAETSKEVTNAPTQKVQAAKPNPAKPIIAQRRKELPKKAVEAPIRIISVSDAEHKQLIEKARLIAKQDRKRRSVLETGQIARQGLNQNTAPVAPIAPQADSTDIQEFAEVSRPKQVKRDPVNAAQEMALAAIKTAGTRRTETISLSTIHIPTHYNSTKSTTNEPLVITKSSTIPDTVSAEQPAELLTDQIDPITDSQSIKEVIHAHLEPGAIPPALPSATKAIYPYRYSNPETPKTESKSPRGGFFRSLTKWFSKKPQTDQHHATNAPPEAPPINVEEPLNETPTGENDSATKDADPSKEEQAIQDALTEVAQAPSKPISPSNSWNELLDSMMSALEKSHLDSTFSALTNLHEKSLQHTENLDDLESNNVKRLTISLRKIAVLQEDHTAARKASQLEQKSANLNDLNHELRMLMARSAINAGRFNDAAAFLVQTSTKKTINSRTIELMKAAVERHFQRFETAKL